MQSGCSLQVLPCVVGSGATLSTLVSQVTATYKNPDTGGALDETTVMTAILDLAARKAHSGRASAALPVLSHSSGRVVVKANYA